MKKLLLTFCAFMSLISTSEARQCKNEGLYLNAFGGFNLLQDPSDNVGITGGLAAGLKMAQFRVEGEFSYRYNPISLFRAKFQRNTYATMGNVYFDVDLNNGWMTYAGIGVGYAWSKDDCRFKPFKNERQPTHLHRSDKDTGMAYQGIVGVSRNLGNGMDGSVEYRSFMFKNALRDHSCMLSVKKYF